MCCSKHIPPPICIICMDHKVANIRCGVRVVELRDHLTHACMWESERCVIRWIMGNRYHAWIQYGFSEMTEPRGITLKSVADISRLLFYCTCSRSFSFSVCSALFISFFPICLPHLSLSSTVHWQHVDLTNGHLSSLLEQLSLMRTLAADRASVRREPLISLWKMDAVFFFSTSIENNDKAVTYVWTLFFTSRCHVKWLRARPHCITKLSTFIFLALSNRSFSSCLILTQSNSQQQLDEIQQMDEICSIPPAAILI